MPRFFAADIDRLRAPRGDAAASATKRASNACVPTACTTTARTTTTGTGTRYGAGCDSETV